MRSLDPMLSLEKLLRVMAYGLVGGLVGMVLLCPLPAVADTNLEQALIRVYQSHPRLLGVRADLRVTDELIPQARSEWLPRIDGEVTLGRTRRDGSTYGFADTSTDPRSFSIRGVQPLYSGGTTYAKMQRSRFEVQAGRHSLRRVEQDVLLDGVQVYLDVLRDRAVLGLSVNNEKVLGQQLQATQDRFDVGEVTLTDLSQADARLSLATAERILQQGVLNDSIARYVAVVGIAPIDKMNKPHLPVLPEGMEQATDYAMVDYPSLREVQFQMRAAERQINEISGEFAPKLTLEGLIRRTAEQSNPTSQLDRMEIMTRLNVPLYQSGAVSSRVRAAKQRYTSIRAGLSEEKRFVRQRVASTWQVLTRARAQSVSFRAQIKANTIALEGVNEEAKVGNRTVLDILNAENELFQARTSLVRSEHDDILAAFTLLHAMGKLTAKDLKLDVEYYDPQRYARSVHWKIWGTSIDDSDRRSPGDE